MSFPVGQGHGIKGRYCGLPDPYGSASFAECVILPVCFDQTSTYRTGSDKGPTALIEASRHLELYDIETHSEVYLRGIHTDTPIQESSCETMLESAYQRTKYWLSQDKFVVTLGGEHTISYGPIRAHAEHHHALTVLQFDAHADLQLAYENNPWSHASAMARVKEIPHVTKIVSVGIRSMSSEELPFLDRPHTLFAHELDEKGLWVNKVLAAITGPVYITFDLDAFDCSLMPSTGTPEPGGLQWNPVMTLLRRLMEEKTVVGCDVVELCPIPSFPAPDFLAAKLIYKILSYKFKGLK